MMCEASSPAKQGEDGCEHKELGRGEVDRVREDDREGCGELIVAKDRRGVSLGVG